MKGLRWQEQACRGGPGCAAGAQWEESGREPPSGGAVAQAGRLERGKGVSRGVGDWLD